MLVPRTGDPVPLPDETVGEGMEERPAVRADRWNFVLVWFMRMLALMWIAKGLGYWAVILGVDSAPTIFSEAGVLRGIPHYEWLRSVNGVSAKRYLT